MTKRKPSQFIHKKTSKLNEIKSVTQFIPKNLKSIETIEQIAIQKFQPISAKQTLDVKQNYPNITSTARVSQLLQQLETPLGILQYGQKEIDNIAKKSELTLAQIEDANVDFITTQLASILTLAQQYQPEPDNQSKLMKLVTSIKNLIIDVKETSLSQINTISEQMDRVVEQIDQSANTIHNKITNLSELYKDNINDYHNLTSLVNDAKIVLDIKQKEYDELISKELNPLDVEIAEQLKQQLTRLDKKLMTFEKMQFMAMQTAPTIRNIQNNGYTLLEKFHVIKTITIPMWKRQVRLYLDSMSVNQGAVLANNIDDANNDMILKASQLNKDNAIKVARLNQRDVVDTTTLIEVNKNLIETFTEVLNIDNAGKEDRNLSRQLVEQAKQEYSNIIKQSTNH